VLFRSIGHWRENFGAKKWREKIGGYKDILIFFSDRNQSDMRADIASKMVVSCDTQQDLHRRPRTDVHGDFRVVFGHE
jgi:hypothetical protein